MDHAAASELRQEGPVKGVFLRQAFFFTDAYRGCFALYQRERGEERAPKVCLRIELLELPPGGAETVKRFPITMELSLAGTQKITRLVTGRGPAQATIEIKRPRTDIKTARFYRNGPGDAQRYGLSLSEGARQFSVGFGQADAWKLQMLVAALLRMEFPDLPVGFIFDRFVADDGHLVGEEVARG